MLVDDVQGGNMKILKVLLLLIILSLLLHSEEITIVTEEFPPYNYQVDGEIKGISSEIVLAVLKEINVTANILSYPWGRAYVLASTKKNYLIYSIARIPEREDLFHWVGSIAPYSTSFYKLKSRTDIKINSLKDAKQYKIGCSNADVITEYLQSLNFTHLEVVTKDVQNLYKLLSNRVDLIAYDDISFSYMIKKEGLDITKYERVYLLEELSDQLYMAFSKSTDIQLVEKFKKGLESIKRKGIFDKIQKKYFF